MGKAPAFQFYPGDWIQDTRILTPLTRGIWIDMLCFMWRSEDRGKIEGTIEQLSRLLSCSAPEINISITELSVTKIADVTQCNDFVTVINRRMYREEKIRKLTRSRVQRFRNADEKRTSNAIVTPPSSSSSSSSKNIKKDIIVKHNTVRTDKIVSGKKQINFNVETKEFEGLNGDHRELWSKAFPAVDIEIQISQAAAWLIANPQKKKSNYLRFLTNWMSRSQERGGNVKSNQPEKWNTENW